jgi:hypothetical protein
MFRQWSLGGVKHYRSEWQTRDRKTQYEMGGPGKYLFGTCVSGYTDIIGLIARLVIVFTFFSVYPDTQVLKRCLPGPPFRTAFFDHAFVTQIGIGSHPLKTPGLGFRAIDKRPPYLGFFQTHQWEHFILLDNLKGYTLDIVFIIYYVAPYYRRTRHFGSCWTWTQVWIFEPGPRYGWNLKQW